MKVLLLTCCFFIVVSACAQSPVNNFVGHWEGELQWYRTGKPTPQKVKMQLIIQPADTAGQYTWQIIYGDKSEDNRPYLLKPVDTANGHWIIDERNGILIDQYYVAGRFTSVFTVEKSTIHDCYYLQNGQLHAEFFSYPTTPVATTGGTGTDVPAVQSFAIRSYQHAVMKKVKNVYKKSK